MTALPVQRPPLLRAILFALVLALTACRDSSVVAYRIPKEIDPVPPATVASADNPHANLPVPGSDMANTAVVKAEGTDLQWTAPAHWLPKPASAMRKASYTIEGDGGAAADVSVTAFPGDVGGEFANVNRWRSQLGLPPIAESELDSAVLHREQAGLHVTIVDLAGAGPAAGHRLLGAIVPFGNATWFFKLTGPDALVARERAAFLEFIGTIKAP